MQETQNPYYHIELSADTDSETEYQTYVKFLTKKEPKKKKFVLSAKSKKYEVFNNQEKIIKECFKKGQYDSLKNEYDNLMQLLKKQTNFVTKYGTPKSFLRVLKFLNESIYVEGVENDSLEKTELKSIKYLKQKLKSKYEEYQTEIEKAIAADLLDINEVSDHEMSEISVQESDQESDMDEMDFHARLTLSKEERRKFWMIKEKTIKKKTKKHKQKHMGMNYIAEEKEFLEEKDEFMRFDLRNIVGTLKKMNEEKEDIKIEDISYNLRFLNAILEKLQSNDSQIQDIPLRKAEIYLLILYYLQEKGQESGIYSSQLLSTFFDHLQSLKQLIEENQGIQPINYDLGEKVNFTSLDFIKRFHIFVSKLNTEFEYALQLIDPFNEQFYVILNQKTQFFLDFFDELKDIYLNLIVDEETKKKYICDLYLKQIEHIYHLSDDFVLNCKEMSEYFEEKSISEKVEELVAFLNENLTDNVKKIKAQLYLCFNRALNGNCLDEVEQELEKLQKLKQVSSSHYHVCLYNRALCRLGLSYFQKGLLLKCKNLLFGICNSGNIQKSLYQYNAQKNRIIDESNPLDLQPYHMHLNIEEIETSFLICCVLLDSHKSQNNQDNKLFQQFLKNYEENMFVNSRNNSKDCVFVCYRKIFQGDFKTAFEALLDISFLKNNEKLEQTIEKQIIKESFLCYVEKLKGIKSISLSLENLSSVFQLSKNEIIQIFELKLKNEELQGNYDKTNEIIEINNNTNEIFQEDQQWELFEKAVKLHQYLKIENNLIEKKQAFKGKNMNPLQSITQQAFPYQPSPFSFARNYDFAHIKKEYINQ